MQAVSGTLSAHSQTISGVTLLGLDTEMGLFFWYHTVKPGPKTQALSDTTLLDLDTKWGSFWYYTETRTQRQRLFLIPHYGIRTQIRALFGITLKPKHKDTVSILYHTMGPGHKNGLFLVSHRSLNTKTRDLSGTTPRGPDTTKNTLIFSLFFFSSGTILWGLDIKTGPFSTTLWA